MGAELWMLLGALVGFYRSSKLSPKEQERRGGGEGHKLQFI